MFLRYRSSAWDGGGGIEQDKDGMRVRENISATKLRREKIKEKEPLSKVKV